MGRIPVNFFTEDISFNLKQKTGIRQWILNTIEKEGKLLAELNFIFCSDEYLLKINQQHLEHDTFTDIITFDNSEAKNEISGDIFISLERIKENAQNFNVPVADELHRVIIHGVLHLLGFKDKNKKEKEVMTAKEDYYLAQRSF